MDPQHTAQLCVVLTRALDLRVDVQKCSVEPIRDRPTLIDVRVVKAGGQTVRREANAIVIYGYEKPLGDLLDEWLGPEPPISGKRDANWMLARAQAMAYKPALAVECIQTRQPTPPVEMPAPAEPDPQTAAGAAQAPGSELDWSDGHQPIAPAASVPDPQPAGPTYVDPDTNETRPMMTRARMVQLGMTREQRARQYAKQGGQHPDDPK